eukprot:m.155441 g.155441  ORF g.155441 m.155441 type:complete len:320 (-) comp30936_c0_seq1:207-1166(-)
MKTNTETKVGTMTQTTNSKVLKNAKPESWSEWDERVTVEVYRGATISPLKMKIARMVNFLVDDGPFIGMLTISWLGGMACRRFGYLPPTSCFSDAVNEFYLRFMMWTVIESIIKLSIRKPRPSHYGRNRSLSNVAITIEELRNMSTMPSPHHGVMIPGDQYSFPSGHTLRAFGCARILVGDPLISSEIGSRLGVTNNVGVTLLLALAFTIGWARVALGKHSILDVVGGGFLGVVLCDFFEKQYSDNARWQVQQFCLLYFTLIAALSLRDLTRKSDKTDFLGLRKTLGFLDSPHQINFLFLPFLGSWIMALGSGTCPANL